MLQERTTEIEPFGYDYTKNNKIKMVEILVSIEPTSSLIRKLGLLAWLQVR